MSEASKPLVSYVTEEEEIYIKVALTARWMTLAPVKQRLNIELNESFHPL